MQENCKCFCESHAKSTSAAVTFKISANVLRSRSAIRFTCGWRSLFGDCFVKVGLDVLVEKNQTGMRHESMQRVDRVHAARADVGSVTKHEVIKVLTRAQAR